MIIFDVVNVPAFVCHVQLPVGSILQCVRRVYGRVLSTRMLVDAPVSRRERNVFLLVVVAIDLSIAHKISGTKSSVLSLEGGIKSSLNMTIFQFSMHLDELEGVVEKKLVVVELSVGVEVFKRAGASISYSSSSRMMPELSSDGS